MKGYMDDKLETLLGKIKELEHELLHEIHDKEQQFHYQLHERKAHFAAGILAAHKKLGKSMTGYLYDAKLFSILTAPMIWFCLVPVLFLHLVATIYQFVCFPVYGIPKVRRQDYIVMDRRRLAYLNSIGKLNCIYCEYVNGLLAYVTEIAGRTEQYWCPIKHAIRLKSRHSRYQYFLDYGDAEQYRQRLEEVRRAFDDLKKQSKTVQSCLAHQAESSPDGK
jgi:hypothetical protein